MTILSSTLNLFKCYICNKKGDIVCNYCFSKLEIHEKREKILDVSLLSFYKYNHIASRILLMSKYPPYHFNILKHIIRKTLVPFFEANSILCPVPLSSIKMFERKYNQAELIAQELGQKQKILVYPLLTRKKDTNPLFKLNYFGRKKEIEGAFKLNLYGHLTYRRDNLKVLLVDDLVTTSQTLKECILTLKNCGFSKIEAYSLFRA